MALFPSTRDFFSDPFFAPSFGQLASSSGNNSWLEKSEFKPRCDIKETDNEIQVIANFPGVKKENVNVEIHDGVLSISGEMHEDREEKSKDGEEPKYHRVEREYGSFRRSFSLPDSKIDATQVQADFQDGVLRVTVPKTAQVKPSKVKVAIK
eukprot:Nk52_evm17s2340 gene=Nk52_evmTU17s2340